MFSETIRCLLLLKIQWKNIRIMMDRMRYENIVHFSYLNSQVRRFDFKNFSHVNCIICFNRCETAI